MAEPTMDQLARFAAVRAFGPGAPDHVVRLCRASLESHPTVEASWRQQHRDFQAALNATSTHESETGAPAQRPEREDGVSR